MSLLVVFVAFYYLTCTCLGSDTTDAVNSRYIRQAGIPPQPQPVEKLDDSNLIQPEKSAVLDVKLGNSKNGGPGASTKVSEHKHMLIVPKNGTTKSETVTEKVDTPIDGTKNKKTIKDPAQESGVLLRGVLVFVGLSVLFMIYVAFRTYYGKRHRQTSMVRKYGVRTRRSDLEMTPLPLEEDEDDETVFDLGNVNR